MLTGPRLLLALCGLAFLACQSEPAPQTEAAQLTDNDRNAIQAGVAELDTALLQRNWSKAASIYTEDGMALPPGAPAAKGRAAVQKLFSGFPKVSAFKQNVVEVNGNSTLAYARATYEAEMTPPGSKSPVKDVGKVIAVWKKGADGSWRVAQAIWNSDAQAPGLTAR